MENTKGYQLKVDYDNQWCFYCKGELERPKRRNKAVCDRCRVANSKIYQKTKAEKVKVAKQQMTLV